MKVKDYIARRQSHLCAPSVFSPLSCYFILPTIYKTGKKLETVPFLEILRRSNSNMASNNRDIGTLCDCWA